MMQNFKRIHNLKKIFYNIARFYLLRHTATTTQGIAQPHK